MSHAATVAIIDRFNDLSETHSDYAVLVRLFFVIEAMCSRIMAVRSATLEYHNWSVASGGVRFCSVSND